MIAIVVAVALLSPAAGMSVSSSVRKARQEQDARDQAMIAEGASSAEVNAVFEEELRRCKDGDVDGATQASLLWWKPQGKAKMTLDQFHQLLDVCLAKNGMLGEVGGAPKGSKCALGSEAQCAWAQKCLATKDCKKPPIAEILAQLKAATEEPADEKKGKPVLMQQGEKGIDDINLPTMETVVREMKAANEGPKMVFTPGTWVARCPACNLALNMVWWAEEDGPMLKDLPVFSELDTLVWDMIVPFAIQNPAHGMLKDPVKVAAKMDKDLNTYIDVANGLEKPLGKKAKNIGNFKDPSVK